jgi:dTDP-4-dehydrorhamnose reductase
VFHMTGSGEGSWADLAKAVFEASAAVGGPSAKVNAIGTKDYPTPAARPANSRLECGALERAYGVRLPDWRQSVAQVVARLIKEKEQAA